MPISGVGMGMGFAPTWLRQVSPPASQNHFNHWVHQSSFPPLHRYQIPRGTPSGGVKYTGVGKLRFSIEITVYLGNGTR